MKHDSYLLYVDILQLNDRFANLLQSKIISLENINSEAFRKSEYGILLTNALLKYKSKQITLQWRIISVSDSVYKLDVFLSSKGKEYVIHTISGSDKVVAIGLSGIGIENSKEFMLV